MQHDILGSSEIPFLDPEDEMLARKATKAGAMALVINPEGMVLHLRDDKPGIPHPGCWSLFGGAVEPPESPYQTAVRELREELGIKDATFRPLCRLIDRGGDGRILSVFEARTSILCCDMTLAEGQAFNAFSTDDALKLRLAPLCHRVLTRFYASGS